MSKVFQAMEKAKQLRGSSPSRALPARPVPFPRGNSLNTAESRQTMSSVDEDLDLTVGEAGMAIRDGQFGPPDSHLVSLVSPDSAESEQYRSLRHTIEQLNEVGRAQVLAITSGASRDGKTVTTLNLAGALAQKRRARVLVVDADLRQPAVATYLNMNASPKGLGELVSDRNSKLEDAIRRHRRYNLNVLAARSAALAPPYEILKSARLDALLQEARSSFDCILLDCPPLTVPDCRLLEKNVDGFLLVVAAHRTPRDLVESALDSLDPEKLLGVVFNYGHKRAAGYDYKEKRVTATRIPN